MSFLVYLTDFSPKLEACIVLSHETFHILIRMLHEMCIYNVCQCTHIQIYNTQLLFVFQFQSQLWGIPVCCQIRSERTVCVRNLSKKKIGELLHLLTLLMVVFFLNPCPAEKNNSSTALTSVFLSV